MSENVTTEPDGASNSELAELTDFELDRKIVESNQMIKSAIEGRDRAVDMIKACEKSAVLVGVATRPKPNRKEDPLDARLVAPLAGFVWAYRRRPRRTTRELHVKLPALAIWVRPSARRC